ncbi:7 transmembrane receptor (rhodopsin family) domain-containing protein [Ditylenchus destructor]|nr:7 transmembrane receptor (rhodopsin family) domain-containing protein [Ditylenchus destructor]
MDNSINDSGIFPSSSSIMDDSSSSPFLEPSTSELIEMLYQMGLFAVGTPLNAFALLKFSRSNKRRNSSEMRLLRLSRQLLIAHLMVLCIYCVWRTFWFYNIAWTLGNVFCKIYSFLSALPFHLWSNMVAAVAVDMLYCISAPLKSVNNGNKRVSWLIAISWIFAFACSTPMLIFRGTVQIPGTEYEQCYPLVDQFETNTLMGFHFFHVITTFYVPLTIILLCYFLIGLSLRHQMAKRKVLGNDVRRLGHNTTIRFLYATACIVLTFVLTWLPYQVLALLRVICEPDSYCETMTAKFTWLQAILIASTCINPFLYRFGLFKSRRGPNSKTTVCSYFGVTPGSCTMDSTACMGVTGGGLGSGSVARLSIRSTTGRIRNNVDTKIEESFLTKLPAPTPRPYHVTLSEKRLISPSAMTARATTMNTPPLNYRQRIGFRDIARCASDSECMLSRQ